MTILGHARGGVGVEEGADGGELVREEGVEEDDVGCGGEEFFEGGAGVGGRQGDLENVEEGGVFLRLSGKVYPEIGFVGGGDRVAAHRGVAVESVDFTGAADAHAGEEISEDAVPAERGSGDEERDEAGVEDVGAYIDRAADAARGRGGVEGGADFVVNVRGAECAKGGEGGAEDGLHRVGREGAGEAGDADGFKIWIRGELGGCGWLEEKAGAEAGAGEEFKGVGRAGEVVGVVGEAEVGRRRKRAGVIFFGVGHRGHGARMQRGQGTEEGGEGVF